MVAFDAGHERAVGVVDAVLVDELTVTDWVDEEAIAVEDALEELLDELPDTMRAPQTLGELTVAPTLLLR